MSRLWTQAGAVSRTKDVNGKVVKEVGFVQCHNFFPDVMEHHRRVYVGDKSL